MLKIRKTGAGLLCLCIIYLALTLPSLFSTHHILFNLEPYPDGLLYIQPALNLATGHGFGLRHEQFFLRAWVPPLYSFVLAAGYVFWPAVQSFYLVNVVLGLGSLICLVKYLQKINHSNEAALWGGAIFLLCGYVIWLPTLPMAENVSLTLFCASLYTLSLLKEKVTHTRIVFLTLLIAGFVFARYALVAVSGVFFLDSFATVIKQKAYSQLKSLFITGLFLGAIFLIYEVAVLHFNPLSIFTPQLETKSATQITAFSAKYLEGNLKFYFATLLGGSTQFLWLRYKLVTPVLSLIALISIGYLLWKRSPLRGEVLLLFGLAAATLGSVIFFYSADARYILLCLPILIILAAYLYAELKREKKINLSLIRLGAITFLFLHLLLQVSFFKYLVATNLLQRSQAWQYESVQTFNHFFQTKKNNYLITVLPPFFVDLYTNHNYRVLPLSVHQEFMNQHQQTWPITNYLDLIGEYRQLIVKGNPVYLTNAYLSSQHEFNLEYQDILQSFTVTQVATGCLNTCNLYQLNLR